MSPLRLPYVRLSSLHHIHPTASAIASDRPAATNHVDSCFWDQFLGLLPVANQWAGEDAQGGSYHWHTNISALNFAKVVFLRDYYSTFLPPQYGGPSRAYRPSFYLLILK